ncbi:MAG: DUF493 family protein [Desulfovibrionales bacterium]
MNDYESLQKTLDKHYDWPAVYTFKLIVPKKSAEKLLSVFESDKGLSVRESRNGKYLSVTANVIMPSSESVIAVYEAVAEIEGIISL